MESEGKTGLSPVRDVPAFLECLRRLKAGSGLTLRQLEERAAAVGDSLPRSTLSHMLGGHRLPRPELLAAFVRACGAERHLAHWLEARDAVAAGRPATAPLAVVEGAVVEGAVGEGAAAEGRVAEKAGAVPPPATAIGFQTAPGHPTAPSAQPQSPRQPPPPRRGKRFGRPRVLVPLVAVVLGAVAVGVFGGGGEGPGEREGRAAAAEAARGAPGAASADGVPRGPVRVRPFSAPELCLTDGRVPGGRYSSQVAVQRPCADTAPQTTELRPEPGTRRYRVQWRHPEFGTGCLKVLHEGPGRGLLEPQDACERTDLFRIVRAREHDGYHLRTEDDRCVAVARPTRAAGTEAVVQRCTEAPHQTFRIEPARS